MNPSVPARSSSLGENLGSSGDTYGVEKPSDNSGSTRNPYGTTRFSSSAWMEGASLEDPIRAELPSAGTTKMSKKQCQEIADECLVWGSGLWGATAGEETDFTIQAREKDGDACTKGGLAFSASIKAVDAICDPADSSSISAFLMSQHREPFCEVHDFEDGTYGVRYRLSLAGQYRISVTLGESHVQGSPFQVEILPGDPSSEATCVSGRGSKGNIAGHLAWINLTLKDKLGNICGHNRESLSVFMRDAEDPSATPITMTSFANPDGSYSISYTAQNPGKYDLKVFLGDREIGKSPYHLRIVPKSDTQRCKLKEEIVSSEQVYVKNLQFVVDAFLKPCRSLAATGSKKVTMQDVDLIFCNMETLLELHINLLKELEERLQDWPIMDLGDIVLRAAPYYSVYLDYVNNYLVACKHIQALATKSKEFQSILSDAAQKSEEKRDLSSFLIMPVQRLPRYQLLLQNLLRETPETPEAAAERTALVQSLSVMKEVVDELEAKNKDEENRQKVEAIQAKFVGSMDQPLVDGHRRWVMESSIMKISRHGVPQQRYMFLFNDIILVAKRSYNSFRHKNTVDLHGCMVESVVDSGSIRHAFQLYSSPKSMTLCCSSAEERDSWVEAILAQIRRLPGASDPMTTSQQAVLGGEVIGHVRLPLQPSQSPEPSPHNSHGSHGSQQQPLALEPLEQEEGKDWGDIPPPLSEPITPVAPSAISSEQNEAALRGMDEVAEVAEVAEHAQAKEVVVGSMLTETGVPSSKVRPQSMAITDREIALGIERADSKRTDLLAVEESDIYRLWQNESAQRRQLSVENRRLDLLVKEQQVEIQRLSKLKVDATGVKAKSELQKELKSKKTEIELFKKRIGELESALATATKKGEREMHEFVGKLSEAENRIRLLEKKDNEQGETLKAAQQENAGLGEQLRVVKYQYGNLMSGQARNSEEVTRLMEERDSLSSQLQELQTRMDKLSEQGRRATQSLQVERATIAGKLEALTLAKNQQAEQLRLAQTELSNTRARMAHLESESQNRTSSAANRLEEIADGIAQKDAEMSEVANKLRMLSYMEKDPKNMTNTTIPYKEAYRRKVEVEAEKEQLIAEAQFLHLDDSAKLRYFEDQMKEKDAMLTNLRYQLKELQEDNKRLDARLAIFASHDQRTMASGAQGRNVAMPTPGYGNPAAGTRIGGQNANAAPASTSYVSGYSGYTPYLPHGHSVVRPVVPAAQPASGSSASSSSASSSAQSSSTQPTVAGAASSKKNDPPPAESNSFRDNYNPHALFQRLKFKFPGGGGK